MPQSLLNIAISNTPLISGHFIEHIATFHRTLKATVGSFNVS